MTPSSILVFLQSEADVPDDDGWVSPEEARVLSGLRFPKRREDWRLGRWTAKGAVRAALESRGRDPSPPQRVRISTASDGSPLALLDGRPVPLAISISHRDGWAACAVSPGGVAIGCDLEVVEPRTRGFVEDYFTDAERQTVSVSSDSARTVTLIWSAKESALKALRTGLRADTRSVAVEVNRGRGVGGWDELAVRERTTGRCFSGWWRVHHHMVLTVVGEAGGDEPPLLLGGLPTGVGGPQRPEEGEGA